MSRAKKKDETRRGSPEAIAKRRSARKLNILFEQGPMATGLDGRKEKRHRRLLKELKEGRSGQPIKAHEVLSYVTELLGMGETLGSIRKMKPLLPPRLTLTEETLATIRDTQAAYAFDARAWSLLGVDVDAVVGTRQASPPVAAKRARKRSS